MDSGRNDRPGPRPLRVPAAPLQGRAGKIDDEDGIEERSLAYQRLMHEIYAAQRSALVRLRNEHEISAEVMRRVERELDLENPARGLVAEREDVPAGWDFHRAARVIGDPDGGAR